ncbi:MAG TPA: hypothetical protein PLJ04_01365 [Candidatus Saccharibacteria bacterium]|nr:hypothetical protein [Candidatus Nomurabacteria bacterium]HPR10207.1 hypothetical protein [Candidatus Saccharibacteria bacterium]
MQFFGAFTLLVLPLFLVLCIRMIQQSTFKDTFIGKLLIVFFYINIFLAIAVALYLISLV